MHALLIAMLAAQSLDISTTLIGLHKGCSEQTFYLKNSAGIAAMKGSTAIALSFTLPILSKQHPKLSKGFAIGEIGSGLLGGTLNLRTLPKCHH